MNYDEAKGKETSPEETVFRITARLKEAGISVTEKLYAGDVENTFYSRISVDNMNGYIGTNGKGMTEAYCRASGYAELMERLQNRCFPYVLPEEKEVEIISEPENSCSSIRICTMKELLELDGGLTRDFLAREVAKMPNVPALAANMAVFDLLRQLSPYFRNDTIPVYRAWDYKNKNYIWAPHYMMMLTALSNGMAAGNTIEEAIVQGASEIFERNSQHTVITEGISMPDIPEEVLSSVTGVYSIINRIRSTDRYDVYIKDASLGKGFPVVCGIIVDRMRQTFGVKFGSSPSFAIALERIFTEAMQGRTLEEFTKINRIEYDPKITSDPENLFNVDKSGIGCYPPSIFCPEPDYPFVPWEDVRGLNNKILAKRMLDMISAQSSRLLIEDVSCLGFPSVFIYAEGFGTIHTLSLRREVLKACAGNIMRRIGTADDRELKTVLAACETLKSSVQENNLSMLYHYKPLADEPKGGLYSMFLAAAFLAIKLGSYTEAEKWLSRIPESADTENGRYCNALKSYVRAMKTGTPAEIIKYSLRLSTDEKTYEQLNKDIFSGENMLEHIYGTCSRTHCEDCPNPCMQPRINELFSSILRRLRDSGVMTSGLHILFGGE